MKIGFFGDSFCMEFENLHSEKYQYTTYLELVKNHYSADIVHLGEGGSSVWDVIINQFPSFQDNLPDICIFCWTDTYRLFHKDFRSLTGHSVLRLKDKDINENHVKHKDVFEAAKHYFLKLHDHTKADLEAKSALHYFDDYVLHKIAGKTKIFHMWSFEKYYDWKHGVEIDTPLVSITKLKNLHPEEDHAPNHFGDQEKNNKVFEIIKSNIDSILYTIDNKEKIV
jgi:hypothetical protein